MAVFNIGVSSFTAYCSGSSKKIDEEKKPSKGEYVNVKLGNGEMSMLEFKQFCEIILNSDGESGCPCQGGRKLPSVCTFCSTDIIPRSSCFKYLVKKHDMIIFEPGSFAIKRISNIFEEVGINKNETVWKKEIVPLNDYYANIEKSKVFEKGFKLILTNTRTGHKLIFKVSFGNSFTGKFVFKL